MRTMPSGQFAGDQVIKFVGMARREQRRVASVRSPKPAQCPRRSPSRGCAVGRCALSRDTDNPLRQDLWRAGHAHAGVWLILALVVLRYVDEANLSDGMKWLDPYRRDPGTGSLLLIRAVAPCHDPEWDHLSRLCRRSAAGSRRARPGRRPRQASGTTILRARRWGSAGRHDFSGYSLPATCSGASLDSAASFANRSALSRSVCSATARR